MKFKTFLESDMELKLAYHDELNPALWDKLHNGYELKPKVDAALLRIANKFIETLKLPSDAVSDIIFTGSNVNYNWTKLSDIDIHVILDLGKVNCEDCKEFNFNDCLFAKKALWNERHDMEIYGFPVELYAQDGDNETGITDSGSFSIKNNAWIKVPSKHNVKYKASQIKHKVKELANQIDDLTKSGANDATALEELNDKLSRFRRAGLESGGEFSLENLVFKALRNNGYVEKLRDQIMKAQDDELSLKKGD